MADEKERPRRRKKEIPLIRTAEDAKKQIIDGARARFTQLDWSEYFQKDPTQAADFFDKNVRFAMTRGVVKYPLKFIDTSDPQGQVELAATPESMKTPYTEDRKVWLTMRKPIIPQDDASAMRDYLTIVLTEAYGLHLGFSRGHVIFGFMKTNDPFRLAFINASNFIKRTSKNVKP